MFLLLQSESKQTDNTAEVHCYSSNEQVVLEASNLFMILIAQAS